MPQCLTLDSLERSIQALHHKAIYIKSLRFPNYRNLRTNSELPFDFPITILLGRNGTNKSSVLHALYGSPRGQTIADFWFETELDAIPLEKNGLKQSVVHQYQDRNGELQECIKARAPRGELDPDYWEAVKHSKPYGFTDSGVRVSPIKLDVTHLDFRGELPVFDKYFYFPDEKHLESLVRKWEKSQKLRRKYRKQDYLRRRSKTLKKRIDENGIPLSQNELDILQYILERDYLSGKLLEHDLFHGHQGYTILFKTKNSSSYSDAFAGSGESAATLLVHKVINAPDKSLVLLDEPETSLHPRAQQRMLKFLAHYAVRKQLQIVMATHSQYLSEGLPQQAIRVLELSKEDGLVDIRTDLSVNEALHETSTLPPGKTILVEDERAKLVVEAALELCDRNRLLLREFNVIVCKGGAEQIYRDIFTYVKSSERNVFILFDGDQNPDEKIPDEEELPRGLKVLKELVGKITRGNHKRGVELPFSDENEVISYIHFLRKFVWYMPEATPEQLVWNESALKNIIGNIPQNVLREEDYKKRIYELSEEIGVTFDADTVFRFLLKHFLETDSQHRNELLECIHGIRTAASKIG
ncbi:MAG: AAA family ATPase [Cyanothece sp. SIO2G6]|nr:AAA family ATPase [Cyanothece sp. SIO2G6]